MADPIDKQQQNPSVEQKDQRTQLLESIVQAKNIVRDGQINQEEESVYQTLATLANTGDTKTLSDIVRNYLQSAGITSIETEIQTFTSELISRFQKLGGSNAPELKDEFIHDMQHRLSVLKENVQTFQTGTPEAKHDRPAANPKVMSENGSQEKSLQEVRNALPPELRNMQVTDTGRAYIVRPNPDMANTDAISRLDGGTIVAALATAGFTMSALASLQEGVGPSTAMLGMGAFLSGNYIKNQMSGITMENFNAESFAKKHGIDTHFIEEMTKSGKIDWYRGHFGKYGVKSDYVREQKNMNWQFFDNINPEKLSSSLQNTRVNGRCWTIGNSNDKDLKPALSPEEKLQWFEEFFKQNNESKATWMREFQEKDGIKGSYADIVKQNPKILDDWYDILWGLHDRGVLNKKRKSDFIKVGNEIDANTNDDIFTRLTHIEALK